jgi:hypothetical protein
LWQIDQSPLGRSWRGRLAAVVRRAIGPLFEQQQAFNSAVVDHLNRNVPVARQTRESMAASLTVLRDTIAELIRFQSLLVVFLQQITPYVDTRDRDVAGLLRGLSGAINAVADELMKKSEALLARDSRREMQLGDAVKQLTELQASSMSCPHGPPAHAIMRGDQRGSRASQSGVQRHCASRWQVPTLCTLVASGAPTPWSIKVIVGGPPG